ncbi:MAG TPA: glycosyltransferase, partial [Gemmatimonadales bacterium]|nr:glycosyltransferase [Gemmatimonadales bacterium]
MYKGKSVSVVIPAYNVAAHIADVVAGIPHFVDNIFVVNDASRDGTADALAAVTEPRVRVITLERNQGV